MPKQCRHIMTDGDRCHAIALLDKPYCYYHMRVHRVIATKKPPKPKKKALDFAFPDSRASIQLALFQIMNAIGSGQTDPKTAGLLLYSLQIASQSVPRSLDTVPKRPVLCVSETPEGDEVAPECRTFEMPHSCADCINPGPNCPLRDEKEARILAIAYGVDKEQKKPLTPLETFGKELMRYLHGGATPEARKAIYALTRKTGSKTPPAVPPRTPRMNELE